MNSIWQTWSDVHRAINGKKVVLFGKSEDWANKTLRMRSFPVAYIVDNNENLHGTTVEGVEVFSPSRLQDEKKDEYTKVTGLESFPEFAIDWKFTVDNIRHFKKSIPLLIFKQIRHQQRRITRKCINTLIRTIPPIHRNTSTDNKL